MIFKTHHRIRSLKTLICLTLVLFTHSLLGQDTRDMGRINGVLVDADTGQLLISARISLEGTGFVTNSDLNGVFRFRDIPVGIYSISISKSGYQPTSVTEVEVVAGEVANIELPMKVSHNNIVELEAFVVTASDIQNTGVKLLADRREAPAISDAIGSEDFSKFGAGDAADAMSRVTGVSINDGKYVFVRGLGERYSNTLLNGVSLPSADPNKKAVQIDLFPTDLLESIVTVKAFTPDKPGDFTGGSVDIQTKSFPDLYTMSLSTSVGYNTNANLNKNFLSYDGGDTDILGFDDGTRDLPEGVPSDPNDWPGGVFDFGYHTETGEWPSEFFDRVTRKFTPIIAASPKKSFLNQGLSFDVGNSFYLRGDTLVGFVFSLTYDHDYSYYDDGVNARYEQSSITVGDALTPKYIYKDSKSTESARLGLLASLAIQPSTNHEFNLIYTVSQSADDESRFQIGSNGASGSAIGAVDEVRSIIFTERCINSIQLKGDSFFDAIDLALDWNVTYANTSQDQPDVRMINNEFYEDTQDRILVKPNRAPRRIWRSLSEDRWSVGLNLELPILENDNLKRTIKVGGNVQKTNREFDEFGFIYQNGYGGAIFSDFEDAYTFLLPEKIGIVDPDRDPLAALGNFITFNRSGIQNYEGEEKINAFYGMLDFEINSKWRVIAGARQENTDLYVQNLSEYFDDRFNDPEGQAKDNSLLPSFHLVYKLSDSSNLRMSATKTLARPTFREMAPYRSFDSIDGDEFIGNQNLIITKIENIDLRYEWFPSAGEIVAISLFSKDMTDAIESSFREQGGSTILQYVNSNNGRVYGVELEFRKTLAFISEYLEGFSVNTNFTYTKSEVDVTLGERISKAPYYGDDIPNDISIIGFDTSELTDDQIERATAALVNTPSLRRLFGQPDYIFNASLQYEHPGAGFSASLNYNYVGEKIAQVSAGPTPDIYQKARGQLDLILHYEIGDNWNLKFGAKNLTNSTIEAFYNTDVQEIYNSYEKGTTFSMGASYKFN
jgi:outer membrane receptor protein involved in Fe transport